MTGQPAPWLGLAASANVVEGENTDTGQNLALLPANKIKGSLTDRPPGGVAFTEP